MGRERDRVGERGGHAVALGADPRDLAREQPQATREREQQQEQEESG
jgi:hypothetical protein